ncbi:hypothetical protein, partial [Pseudoalteromonas maricaloris]
SHPSCVLKTSAEYELLATWQNKILVRSAYSNMPWSMHSDVPRYKLEVYALNQADMQTALDPFVQSSDIMLYGLETGSSVKFR